MRTLSWWLRCRRALVAMAACVMASPALASEPIIAAAADLKFALEEVAQSFKKDTGQSVKLTFGSSGTFATQIRNGAPFQMYLSADEDYVLDLARRSLHRNGAPVALTSAEFALLKVLAGHPGRVFTRDDLVAAASAGPDRLAFDRSIDARVARLRKKLDDASDAPRYIRTVWGAGYVFVGHEA